MKRVYTPATLQQVTFSDGTSEVSVRRLYKITSEYKLTPDIITYGELIYADADTVKVKTGDGVYEAYVRLSEEVMIHLMISGMTEDEADELIFSAKLCDDNAASLELTEYMNTLVLYFHSSYTEGDGLYDRNLLELIGSQLWQAQGIIPMEISEDNTSVTVNEEDLEALAVLLFGRDAKISGYPLSHGITRNVSEGTYTFSVSESTVYASFDEMYYLAKGNISVEETESTVKITATLNHSTVSLGNTSAVTLVYTFESITQNGFTYLALKSIKNA